MEQLPRAIIPIAIFLLPATSMVIAIEFSAALWLLPFVLLACAGVMAAPRFRFSRNPAQAAAILLPLLMLLAIAANHFNGAGLLLAIAAACGSGLVVATASWDDTDLARGIALPLLLTSAMQTVLIIAQTVTDRAVGLNVLAPDEHLRVIDGLLRPQGTMTHVYEPAALALLAAGVALAVPPHSARLRPVWIGGAALAGATVGLTHSRAALFGLLLIAVFVVMAARRGDIHSRNVGGALLIGFLVAALFTSSAWAYRGEHSTTGGVDDASLGRITLAKQAVQMTADHPLLGVGPGNYMDTMRESYTVDSRYPFIVHNVPLALAAENGIASALIITLLVGWAILRAIRSDPRGGALAVAISGFLLFDVLHYDRVVGLLMLATWLAVLQHRGVSIDNVSIDSVSIDNVSSD